ncbi:MAG TPA: phospholipase A [Rhodocyclaceae bacterium]|jgi:phospholipase A1
MKKTILYLFALAATPVAGQEVHSACGLETNDTQRLACYDRQYRAPASGVEGNHASVGPLPIEGATTYSPMSAEWELDEQDRRTPFTLRTYLPNLLLPFHYTSRINRSPTSPTHANGEYKGDYRKSEAKIQISLRTKVVDDLVLPGAALWVAYTQQSVMQIWDKADSSPFRNSDYQPEAIYVVPISAKMGALPMDWSLRMAQLGVAHQSNGQSDPLSRSWNRIYLGLGLEHNSTRLQIRINQRINIRGSDDNPDLTDYLGRVEIKAGWMVQSSSLGLHWRTNLTSTQRGSLRADWSHPVFKDKPAGLQWYAQLFSGYGETLLDYNHRQTSLGFGLALFQF